MPHDFEFGVTLLDAHGEQTSRSFQGKGYLGLTIEASFLEAVGDFRDFVEKLDAATGARVVGATVSAQVLSELLTAITLKGAPVAGSDVTDVAQYSLFLNTDGGYNKKAVFDVPAPAAALYVSPGTSRDLDISATEITELVAELADDVGGGVQISDGETVDTAKGVGGISSGTWTSRKRRSRA